MGVKSTVVLEREEAETRLVDDLFEMKSDEMKRIIAAHVAAMDDVAIEDRLEALNDERAGGEGFENYHIT